MVDHQGTQHDIERLVGEGELLDHPDLEVDGEAGSLSFGVSPGDLPGTWVNAAHYALQFGIAHVYTPYQMTNRIPNAISIPIITTARYVVTRQPPGRPPYRAFLGLTGS